MKKIYGQLHSHYRIQQITPWRKSCAQIAPQMDEACLFNPSGQAGM